MQHMRTHMPPTWPQYMPHSKYDVDCLCNLKWHMCYGHFGGMCLFRVLHLSHLVFQTAYHTWQPKLRVVLIIPAQLMIQNTLMQR